jgi:hypothetical protein
MLDRYALLTPNVPSGGLKAPTGSCHFATPTHVRVACCHTSRRFPALFGDFGRRANSRSLRSFY